ncbi:MAG: histidine kinase [Chitinophagaceae bacterium]
MHKQINYKRIGAHILFWIAYIAFEVLYFGWKDNNYVDFTQAYSFFSEIPIIVVVVYVNLYFLMPRFFYTKKYFSYGLFMLLLLLIGAFYMRIINYSIWVPYDKIHDYQGYLQESKEFFIPVRIIHDTFYFYFVVALSMLIKILRNFYQHEKKMRELENEKFNAEKTFLKAQLHPHFFFNTLSILYSLTRNKSDKAPAVVLQLSDLMHYVLYEANSNFVLLEKDVNHLKNYN